MTTTTKLPDGTFRAVLADGRVLQVISDDLGPDSPLEAFDNLGTIVCWHPHYTLGDQQPTSPPLEFLADLAADLTGADEMDEDLDSGALLEIIREHAIVLPLFLYDHGSITISTRPFSCRWDSGQVGFVYVTHTKVREEYGDVTADTLETALKVLEQEVKVYDYFLQGAVYGYVLEQPTTCETCGHQDSEHLDSCFGFYGWDHEESGLRDSLFDATDLTDQDIEGAKITEGEA